MAHVLIAYNALVIVLGFAAFAFAVVRGVQNRKPGAAAFCLAFFLFTLMVVLIVADKYVVTNVSGAALSDIFLLRGVKECTHIAMVFAVALYMQNVLPVRLGRTLAVGLFALTLACAMLVWLPGGAVLLETERLIRLGPGYFWAMGFSLLTFTYAVVLGVLTVVKAGQPAERIFRAGFAVFVTFGYVETAFSFFRTMAEPYDGFSQSDGGFILSSIPYALYCVFLLVWFSVKPARSPVADTGEFRPAGGGIVPHIGSEFVTRFALTAREAEIAALILLGKSNNEIADTLFISLATVKTHLHNVYGKTGVRGRYGLMQKVAGFGRAQS